MDPKIILNQIEVYSAKSGLKISTICQMAFRNAKYFERLSARIERLGAEQQRLTDFIAAHQISSPAAPAAPTQEQSHESTSKA